MCGIFFFLCHFIRDYTNIYSKLINHKKRKLAPQNALSMFVFFFSFTFECFVHFVYFLLLTIFPKINDHLPFDNSNLKVRSRKILLNKWIFWKNKCGVLVSFFIIWWSINYSTTTTKKWQKGAIGVKIHRDINFRLYVHCGNEKERVNNEVEPYQIKSNATNVSLWFFFGCFNIIISSKVKVITITYGVMCFWTKSILTQHRRFSSCFQFFFSFFFGTIFLIMCNLICTRSF